MNKDIETAELQAQLGECQRVISAQAEKIAALRRLQAAAELYWQGRGEPVAWGIFYQGVMQQGWAYNEAAANAIAEEDYPEVKVTVKPLYLAPQPAEPVKEPSDGSLLQKFLDAAKKDGVTHLTLEQPAASADDQWCRLALQFDAHRMQALGTLRAAAKVLANGGLYDDLRNSIEAFLAAPPLPGEQALADRIAAMATLPDPEMAGRDDIVSELQHAHQIIRNALAIMTTDQKSRWADLNARDCCDGEGTTRANERADAIAKAMQQEIRS